MLPTSRTGSIFLCSISYCKQCHHLLRSSPRPSLFHCLTLHESALTLCCVVSINFLIFNYFILQGRNKFLVSANIWCFQALPGHCPMNLKIIALVAVSFHPNTTTLEAPQSQPHRNSFPLFKTIFLQIHHLVVFLPLPLSCLAVPVCLFVFSSLSLSNFTGWL